MKLRQVDLLVGQGLAEADVIRQNLMRSFEEWGQPKHSGAANREASLTCARIKNLLSPLEVKGT